MVGYEPNPATVEVNITDIQQDTPYKVTYNPAQVNFTVKHYQQNVGNDNYTLKETETKTGYTESPVGDSLKKSYAGFTALLYDTTTKIAADGSTVVEIYYDRNYYLLTLNLDGGYGADPVYARYGAPISVAEPTKPGYTFGGWSPAIPETMQFGGSQHTAKWTLNDAVNFTVVFWYENADDANYSYAGSITAQAKAGTEVKSADYQNTSFTGRDNKHFTYNADKAETVTVKGDSSTVLNVYFTRNTYTLTFRELTCNDGWMLWHDHSDSCYTVRATINAKYNQKISDEFSKAPFTTTYNGRAWKCTDTSKYNYALQTLDRMPGFNATFNLYDKSSNTKKTIYYYVQKVGTTVSSSTWPTSNANFDLLKQVDTYFKFATYDEEYHEIEGFTRYSKRVSGFDSNNQKKFSNNRLDLYYLRNSYTLKFYNHDAFVAGQDKAVQYEAPLNGYNFTPDYPAELEANAYEFAGWYTTPGCYDGSEVNWETMTMPASDVTLYAKWAPKTHTVRTFRTEKNVADDTPLDTWENVPHRTIVEKPDDPTNGNYTFVGWFYQENGVEKAFDFSMPVTKDLDLYAKWSSNKLVEYTIKYAVKNADETLTYIAEETKGSALAGTTKTFDAKTGTALYAGYQSGYFPEVSSHSLVMDINGNNEYTFIYVQKEKVPYTVKYLEKDTNKVLHDEKNAETSDAVITEKFEQITGYAPDAYQKRLVLAAEGNEIIFWYTKDTEHAPVQIIHWVQNIEGAGYTEYQSSTNLNGIIGETYTEQPLTLDGFTYKADKSTSSGKLTAAGLVLNLYYDRIEYPYEFQFLEQGTNKVLADSVTGSARYQAQVTQTAKNIPGYTLVSANQQAINIAIEDPADVAAKNVKIFYYVEQTVNISYVAVQPTGVTGNTVNPSLETLGVVTGNALGSTATAAAGCVFVGWYKDATCLQPVDAAWVDGKKITPAKTMNYGQDENQQVVLGYEQATYYALFRQTQVTVRKEVTGNLGDQTKDFTFQWKILNADGSVNQESETFTLKHGQQKEILGIPEDATLVIQETNADGYTVTAKHGSDTVSVVSNSVTVNVTDGSTITITNNKEATPDTGVLLDSLPYVVILAVVVLGAALVIVRRRKHRDDD